jgi:hypothetical protein
MVNLIRRIGIVIVFVLVCLTGWLWFMTGKSAKIQAQEKYMLKIYEASHQEAEKIKKVITEEGYSDVSSAKVKRLVPKRSGFRVVTHFDKKDLAENYVKLLNEKSLSSVIKEVPNSEAVFIQVQGSFSDKKKAVKIAAKSKEVIHIDFQVEENFKDISVQTTEIIVKDISGSEKAEALRNKLADIAKDIEVTTQDMEMPKDDKSESKKNKEKQSEEKPKSDKEDEKSGK